MRRWWSPSARSCRAAVLDAPRLGAFNLHASLLPRWRGAAPIQRAIMAGDRVTGVAGDAHDRGSGRGPDPGCRDACASTRLDTAGSLHDRLAAVGAALLPRTLAALERGTARARRRSRRTASPTPRRSSPPRRGSIGASPRRRSTGSIRGLSPFARRLVRAPGRRAGRCGSRRCFRASRRARARPGEVLDDAPADRLRRGRGAHAARPARRPRARRPRTTSCAASRVARRAARLMPRYRLTLEYDGGPYNGFQAQGDLPSVQASIERAVKAFCGEALRLQAAGRTDAGVHASGQVVHIDLDKRLGARRGARRPQRPSGPRADRGARRQPGAGRLPRPLLRQRRGAISIASSTARPAGAGARPGLAREEAARRRGHARGGARRWSATTTSPPSATSTARPKSPMKTLDEARVWREGEEVRLAFARPLLPAPAGALDDRHRWPRSALARWSAGRPEGGAGGRGPHAPAARSRRPRGSIWPGWSTSPAAAAPRRGR